MQSRAAELARYLWYVIVMKTTWPLPDWQPIMRFRGFIAKPAFAKTGKNFQISSDVTINFPGNITVGNDVYIAKGSWLNALEKITLESEVMLAPYTIIATGNHKLHEGSYRFGPSERQAVKICKGAWIGAGCKILPGVTVNRSSCCAAGSVVNNDVPAGMLVGGVPAKVINTAS